MLGMEEPTGPGAAIIDTIAAEAAVFTAALSRLRPHFRTDITRLRRQREGG